MHWEKIVARLIVKKIIVYPSPTSHIVFFITTQKLLCTRHRLRNKRIWKLKSHFNLVKKVLISCIRVFLKEFHHYLAHIDFLLHQCKDGGILFTGLHQDIVSKCWNLEKLMLINATDTQLYVIVSIYAISYL